MGKCMHTAARSAYPQSHTRGETASSSDGDDGFTGIERAHGRRFGTGKTPAKWSPWFHGNGAPQQAGTRLGNHDKAPQQQGEGLNPTHSHSNCHKTQNWESKSLLLLVAVTSWFPVGGKG